MFNFQMDNALNLHGLIGGSQKQTIEQKTFGLVKYLGVNTGTVYQFDKNTALSNRSVIHVDNAGNWGKFKVTYFDGKTIDSPHIIERVNRSIGIQSTGEHFFYFYSIPSDTGHMRMDVLNTDGAFIKTKILEIYPQEAVSVVEDRERKRFIVSASDGTYNGYCEIYVFDENFILSNRFTGKNNVNSQFFPTFTGETKIKDGIIYSRTYKTASEECMFIKYDYWNNKTLATMPLKTRDFVCVSTKLGLIYILGEKKIYNFNLVIFSHNVTDVWFLINTESKENYKLSWVSCQNPNGENDDLILVNGQGNVLTLRLEKTKEGVNRTKVVGSFSATNTNGWDSDIPNKNSRISTKGDVLLGVWSEYGLIRR
ncbi:hypothetical protein HYI19_18585 [Clostridium botulinum]|uniref:hypothetical protein n=1 Tax=Clostridium botulinum TaxID=1491 RepID=UPI001C9A5EEE|nr:hypothetical protein [Clostridium botulinum]MBY6846802.1 hypothetical protein [Clostridium botulinum]